MNLFYSKTKIKFLAFSCLLLLSFFFLQSSITRPNEDFLKKCKSSDAYLAHYFTDVTYSIEWGSFKRYTSINYKMVLNNNAGIDTYAYLDLSEYVSNNIEKIDIKTKKSDGAILQLDSSLVFEKNGKTTSFGAIHYPIPGVEPGDTIETNYTYSESLRKYEMKEFVSLFNELPSLKSEFTVRTGPELSVRFKRYNDFPDAKIVANDTLVYCLFESKELEGYKQNEYSCFPCELPYMYYSIEDRDSELTTWKDVYNEEFNFISQPLLLDNQNSTYYNRWKRRVLGEAQDSSKFYQFTVLHDYILKNFEIEEIKNRRELIKSDGYFLKKNRFDPISIRRIFRRMLEDLEIDYWAVFARSKRVGPIDPELIRKGEFDHIFFAYKNNDGQMRLLYPHDATYKYLLDEIPTALYNTDAVLVKPILLSKKDKRNNRFIGQDLELASADSVQVNLINLPGSSSQFNKTSQVVYANVDLKNKTTPLKYRFSATGGMFTEINNFFRMLSDNEEVSTYYKARSMVENKDDVIQIDSIASYHFKETKPFNYTMSGIGKINGAINFLSDKMTSISLDKLIEHNLVKMELNDNDLSYYLDFAYSEQNMVIFEFPKNVEVLDVENYNQSVANEVGSYSFNIRHKGDNIVTLESIYKIKEDIIPKNSMDDLEAINSMAKTVQNRRLIIKIKNQ